MAAARERFGTDRQTTGWKPSIDRRRNTMKYLIALSMIVPMAVAGTPASAKGCLKGAAVGGVAGHVAGHHGMMGAAAGCAIGHHHAHKMMRKH
jgi:outer membrane lipoprotein SlyB